MRDNKYVFYFTEFYRQVLGKHFSYFLKGTYLSFHRFSTGFKKVLKWMLARPRCAAHGAADSSPSTRSCQESC